MVIALDSGSSSPCSALAGDTMVLSQSGKTLYSHSASLHPGIQMVPVNLMLGETLPWSITSPIFIM